MDGGTSAFSWVILVIIGRGGPMKIEHFSYFLAMRDSSSLSEAAAKAHISQQGYGKAIVALEDALGCKLLERDAKGARLTNAGALVMHYAETIVSAYGQMTVGLATQSSDLEALQRFDGCIAFSNVCMNSFEPIFSARGLLSRASKDELSLDELLERASEREWICIGDVCAQVYEDHAERWDIEPLVVGRVGIIVPRRFLREAGSESAEAVAASVPLAVFDCQATREIYSSLLGKDAFSNVKIRTTRDEMLREGLRRGDFALLSDSFHWSEFQSAIGTSENPLTFIPFKREFVSLFGFVRKKGLPYSDEQRAVVDAAKRTFANVSKTVIRTA